MTNREKIVCDLLVYIAQTEECVFPDKLNCAVCPFSNLCMFAEFPEEDIRKWLESEVEAGAYPATANVPAVCGGGTEGVVNGKTD